MMFFRIVLTVSALFFFSGCCFSQLFSGGSSDCARQEFEGLVKQKRYAEAFEQLDPEGLKTASYGQKAAYDILNVLVNGRSIQKEELFNYDAFRKYADNISWTIGCCRVLVIYLETGRVDAEWMARLERQLHADYPEEHFWYDALKDLDRPES